MFCACVTDSTEGPVEAFEYEIINVTRCIALASLERYEAPSRAGSSDFFELRTTRVLKAQNLRQIHMKPTFHSWEITFLDTNYCIFYLF
jgi:hypothetical protein